MRLAAAVLTAFLALPAAATPPAAPARCGPSYASGELSREVELLRREVAALTGASRFRGQVPADRASLAREVVELRRELARYRAASVPLSRIGGGTGGSLRRDARPPARGLQLGKLGTKRRL